MAEDFTLIGFSGLLVSIVSFILFFFFELNDEMEIRSEACCWPGFSTADFLMGFEEVAFLLVLFDCCSEAAS